MKIPHIIKYTEINIIPDTETKILTFRLLFNHTNKVSTQKMNKAHEKQAFTVRCCICCRAADDVLMDNGSAQTHPPAVSRGSNNSRN